MQNIRILEIPDCKMASSGFGMFGQARFDRFCEWFSALPRGIFPKDFLTGDDRGMCWLYLCDGVDVPEEFEVVDFRGGLYAVATDVDQQTDMDAMGAEVDIFLSAHGFVRDPSRSDMGNIPTPPSARDVMGFEQMDYWFPIRVK